MLNRKVFFAILIVIVMLTSVVYAQIPNPLKDVKVSTTVAFDPKTGIYSFSYEIYNPTINDGQIRSFEIDITGKTSDTTLSCEGLINGPCYEEHTSTLNLQRTQMVPIGIDGPSGFLPDFPKATIWGCGLSANGSASWGSADEPYRIFPGKKLGGFKLTSCGLPGIRQAALELAIDYDNLPAEYYENVELTKQLQDSLAYKTKTVGPTAPPADFKPLDFLNYIIDLKHQSAALGWITDKGIENSLDVKLDNAKRKIEAGDMKTAQNTLNAFMNEVEAQNRKSLTSEAYVLLKYNAQYLIDHLPK